MNIKLARCLDYWLGVPLCFVVGSISRFLHIMTFRQRKANEVPRKILFIKLSEMGAIILSYPLLRRTKKEYPNTNLFFLTFERNRSVFKSLDNVIADSNILVIRENSIWFFVWDTFNALKKIRKQKIDIVFDLEFFSRFTTILTYFVGAGKRIGFYRYSFEGLYRGNLLTHRVQYNPLLHIAKVYLSLLQATKKEVKHTPELDEAVLDNDVILPKFISTVEKEIGLRDRLKKFSINRENRLFLLAIGEGELPLREWPLDNFISLSKRILEDAKNYIILIGAREVSKKAELLYKDCNNKRCINLIGKTTISELLELFNMSEILVANDCGLAQLASLTSIKKFILFGPESPEIFGPIGKNNWIIYSNLPCSPCFSALNHRKSECRDNKCLKIIKYEEVYDLIKQHL